MKEKPTFVLFAGKILLIGITILSICGCSNSNDAAKTQVAETSTTQSELSKAETSADIVTSFNSENELWEYLENTYPQVTKTDIQSGKYTGHYVLIDSYAKNVEVTSYNYVSCDMYFATSAGKYEKNSLWACFFGDEDLKKNGCISGQQYLANMQNGQSFRGCYYINSDNSFGAMNMLAIKLLESTSNIESTDSTSHSTDSRLKNATIFKADVLNGTRTDIIGQRAYIIIPKSALQEITEAEYSDFLASKVKDSGYNWFSIICDDGTGIIFNGCVTSIGTYGKMDQDGNASEAIGYITLTENGYIYEAAK